MSKAIQNRLKNELGKLIENPICNCVITFEKEDDIRKIGITYYDKNGLSQCLGILVFQNFLYFAICDVDVEIKSSFKSGIDNLNDIWKY